MNTAADRSLSSGLTLLAPGLLFTAAIAGSSIELSKVPFLAKNGIGSLTLAILFGMLAGNTLYPRIAPWSATGVGFSKKELLRLGIIAYGLRLTFQDVASVGLSGILIDAVMLISTFALACWFGTKVLGLDRHTSMLVGIGSSICGAAAILAAEPVVRGRPEQAAVAVATVVVFGTLAMFAYPVLYQLSAAYHVFQVTPSAYGIFAGSTIHEVAQVLVAGRAVSEAAAGTAVIAKMVRVMMLAPFLIALASLLERRRKRDGARGIALGCAGRAPIPWFAVGFALLAALNSCLTLPPRVVHAALQVDGFMLAMAMAALGVTTQFTAIRAAGIKPLLLASVLFAWLLCGGLAVNVGGHLLEAAYTTVPT